MWQPQMEGLTDYSCLAPDLPEQGKSLSVGPFRLEDAAKRVIELIEERVPNQRAHLVGLSLGAAVTLTIMHLSPAYVDHAIITRTAQLKAYGKLVIALIPLMKLFNIEKQVDASYQQFGIPEAYRATFREDLLPAFTRHSIGALIELNRTQERRNELVLFIVGIPCRYVMAFTESRSDEPLHGTILM
jgi:alpha-beta hydrolase superfamily lysophospholipase